MINILSKELDIWINKWRFKEFVAIAITKEKKLNKKD